MATNPATEYAAQQWQQWLELAQDNPDLRSDTVWLDRINNVTAPELDVQARYLSKLNDLTPQQQRVGYAYIALALACYDRLHQRSLWGFCLSAASSAMALDHRKVMMWFNQKEII